MGTPSEAEWTGYSALPDSQSCFPKWSKKCLASVLGFPKDSEAVQLLEKVTNFFCRPKHPRTSCLWFLRPLWPKIFENLNFGLTFYACQNGLRQFLKFDPRTEICHLKVTFVLIIKKHDMINLIFFVIFFAIFDREWPWMTSRLLWKVHVKSFISRYNMSSLAEDRNLTSYAPKCLRMTSGLLLKLRKNI